MAQYAHSTDPVLIIGAGISELTLAQGLRRRSIPFRLFERRAESHSSQGHRLRISSDSVAALNSVLLPQCNDLFTATAAQGGRFQPRYVDAKDFEFEKPMPASHPQSMPVDRAWLRRLMLTGIEDAIEYEKDFASYELSEDGVHVAFADGSTAHGRLLVGADGIKSRVRRMLQPDRRLLNLERWIVWGRTLLTERLRGQMTEDQLSWFMALDKEANVQVVVEPMTWTESVKGKMGSTLPNPQDYLYWALCLAPGRDLPKTAQERKHLLERVTKAWHPALRLVFDEASYELSACVPVLSSKPDIEIHSSSQNTRVTLIGDSAHAMSPMGGSGGTTAILNAVDLAQSISQYGPITQDIMQGFEERMEKRAKDNIEHSFRGGQKFWKGKEWFEYPWTQD
ncbi:FAD-dependent urate hydroxylase [Lachnellula cervina]|uniref:FAD-dependent urate hydroxylase n=1 Tax=Lachnellula cervina TaxID=1316786 RepID=A0A7D8YTK0_9HELO|nr:FAD-dependent urate hydroxylase [Lachnellula cervina]